MAATQKKKNVKGAGEINELLSDLPVNITASSGDDVITGSSYNDTIKGGLGTNIIHLSTTVYFGYDKIVLTKGENLHLQLDVAGVDVVDYTNSYIEGKNLLIDVYSEEGWNTDIHGNITTHKGDFMGQIKVENYTSKDVITNAGSFGIYDSNDELVFDIRKELRLATDITKNYNSKTFNATWINDDISAENYDMYYDKMKQKKITDVNTKALNIKLGDTDVDLGSGEFNNTVVGSRYSDTIVGGKGNDKITAGTGNDTITGGKGENTIIYNAGDGNDTINLTKGEKLTIELNDISSSNVDYAFIKGNVEISYITNEGLSGKLTLKNFASKDVTNDASKTEENQSYVKLIVGLETIDLREKLYKVDVVKNYTGNWHNEEIDATSYVNLKNTKGLSLNGGKGDDTLIGSDYDDTLYGGDGNDTFVFSPSHGVDTIKDATSYDKIEFRNLTFEQLIFLKNGNNLEIRNTVNDDDKVIIQNFYKIKEEKRIDDIVIDSTTYKISDIPYSDFYITGQGKIKGLDGYTHIMGSDKNDTIKALDTDDDIYARKGNDIIYGGGGHNTFIFSVADGIDTIKDAKAGDIIKFLDLEFTDLIFAQNGKNLEIKNIKNYNDNIVIENYFARPEASRIDTVIVYDTSTSDYETKSISEDMSKLCITGSGKIVGTDEDDDIYGSYKNDTIYGSDGNDLIYARGGNDTIYGGDDDDTIHCETGNNKVDGGNGIDTIYGGDGNDKLYGSDGNDIIYGNYGNNTLDGGNDDDTITAGTGNDIIYGGKGNDTFIFNTVDENNVEVGCGRNTIKDATSGDKIRINGGYHDEDGNYIPLTTSDIIAVKNGNNLQLRSKYNEASNIIILENYFKNIDNVDNLYVNGDTEGDKISISSMPYAIIADKDTIVKGDNNDNIIYGNSKSNIIYGYDGDDTLHGEAGNDTIYGGKGIDTIYGGDGKDKLYGDDGNDILYGGDGNDVLHGGKGKDSFYGGKGNDIIYTDADFANTIYLYKGDGNDTVYGTNLTEKVTPLYQYVGDYLKFADTTYDDLKYYEMDGKDLIIYYNNEQDSVRIKNYLTKYCSVKYISDSSSGVYKALKDLYPNVISSTKTNVKGTEVRDVIYTSNLSTTVEGMGGSDQIETGTGNDVIYTYKKDTKNKDTGDKVIVIPGSGSNSIYCQSESTWVRAVQGDDTYYTYLDGQSTIIDEDVFGSSSDIGKNNLYILDTKHDDIYITFDVEKYTDPSSGNQSWNTVSVNFCTQDDFEKWYRNPKDSSIKGTTEYYNTNGLEPDATSTDSCVPSVENVYSKDNYVLYKEQLGSVILHVIIWMSNHATQFDSTEDVFKNGSPEQIEDLLAQYKVATWVSTNPDDI